MPSSTFLQYILSIFLCADLPGYKNFTKYLENNIEINNQENKTYVEKLKIIAI